MQLDYHDVSKQTKGRRELTAQSRTQTNLDAKLEIEADIKTGIDRQN
jgi:hypothetical protein